MRTTWKLRRLYSSLQVGVNFEYNNDDEQDVSSSAYYMGRTYYRFENLQSYVLIHPMHFVYSHCIRITKQLSTKIVEAMDNIGRDELENFFTIQFFSIFVVLKTRISLNI